MKVAVQVPFVAGQPLAIDLDDQLPPEIARGGTWGFVDPSTRHALQMRGCVLLPDGRVIANTGDVMPVNTAPGSARLLSAPDLTLSALPQEYAYEPGEPGIELANGQVFKTFNLACASTYFLNNYRTQEMVFVVRPGTYYNVIGNFHWTPVQRLTIRAKDPLHKPRFIKRIKVNGYEQGGHILAIRNDCRANPTAHALLENLILEGGMSNVDPGSASLVGMYGSHVRLTSEGCVYMRGNCGPVNYPDSRPANGSDDEAYYSAEFTFRRNVFENVGNSSNHSSATHALYITHSHRLRLHDNYFLSTDPRPLSAGFDVAGGHMAKIGAYYTEAFGNIFDNRLGAYTAMIEYPYGGQLHAASNVILTGDNTTGAGGPGGAQIQAMNEWAAHGITRRNTRLLFERNTQVHVGSKAMRAWSFREKDIPGVGKTVEHMKVTHHLNVTHGPGMRLAAAGNINL